MSSDRPPLIIAHRGESRDAPENTLAALRLAWERGARAVECDVRLSRDGQVVVLHDADLRRVGRSRLRAADSTLAQLQTVDIGTWKQARWAAERVSRLEDFLASVPRGCCLFVEVKVGPEIVPSLARCLRGNARSGRHLVLLSFRRDTLTAIARALPGWKTCLLLTARQWARPGGLAAALAAARELRCTGVDLERHRRLDRTCVASVHAAGLALYVWTVNRPATARRLAEVGVDGITTDRCAWLRQRVPHRA